MRERGIPHRRAGPGSLFFLVLALAPSSLVLGQETRAEVLALERAQRAEDIAGGQLPSEHSSAFEKAVLFVEEGPILRWFNQDFVGFHPLIGDLVTGSGLAAGISYRYPFIDSDAVFQASASVSSRLYRRARIGFLFPTFARVRVGVDAEHRNYPQQAYFGLGGSTSRDGRTSYRLKAGELAVQASYLARSWLTGGMRLSGLMPSLGPGTASDFPTTGEIYDGATAPGLSEQPRFLVTEAFVEADFRDVPANPRAGSFHRLALARYRDLELDRYNFKKTELESVHFLSYFDKRRVLVLRGRLVWAEPDAGNDVPFYLLPYVGGDDTVRGYLEYRFRDRNLLVLNAEHRWEVLSGLDMALFFDAGKVAHHRSDFDFKDLRTSGGVGFRFSTRNRLVLRVDIGAGGGEGTQVFIKFSHGF